ncbi:MAG: signal peptide peptidase SppA [Holophaga sp.]|nr:signal peptide peptidase SppA [Holophaga sp.]
MKDFFRSTLAALLALILFAGGAVALVVGIALVMGNGKPALAPRSVLVLNLSTSFPESVQDASPVGLIQRAVGGSDEPALPLTGVLQALDRASHDPSISGLYLTGNVMSQGFGSGPAALKELREAILKFKADSGKPVIAYNHLWGRKEYYLCAGVGKVYVNPSGEVDVTGLSAEPMFFASALKKYGVQVQVTRVGKYKSAVEPYILDKMSDANREQVGSLLGDIWDDWKGAVAADRRLAPADIQSLSDEKGVLTGPEALKAGLVDRLAAPDQVLDELKALAGRRATDLDFPQVDLETYMRIPVANPSKNRVALLFAEGEIVDGNGHAGQAGGERLSRELRRLRLDPQVKAVVLRVNSPGGSALASELIQREVIVTRKVKPVVVSMGYMAASGGYWISTYGDRIFAEPNTITGSIGVYGLLPNIQKLAAEHGVTWDRIQTSRLADPTSITRPKSDVELGRIQTVVDDIYDQFLTRVADSRKMSKEQVNEIAQGRVWSGRQALKLGLVDELGGIQDAVRDAARRAKIQNDYRVDGPGEPRSLAERLFRMLNSSDDRGLSESRGPAADLRGRFEQVLGNLQSLNDPRGVYARMPFELNLH